MELTSKPKSGQQLDPICSLWLSKHRPPNTHTWDSMLTHTHTNPDTHTHKDNMRISTHYVQFYFLVNSHINCFYCFGNVGMSPKQWMKLKTKLYNLQSCVCVKYFDFTLSDWCFSSEWVQWYLSNQWGIGKKFDLVGVNPSFSSLETWGTHCLFSERSNDLQRAQCMFPCQNVEQSLSD